MRRIAVLMAGGIVQMIRNSARDSYHLSQSTMETKLARCECNLFPREEIAANCERNQSPGFKRSRGYIKDPLSLAINSTHHQHPPVSNSNDVMISVEIARAIRAIYRGLMHR